MEGDVVYTMFRLSIGEFYHLVQRQILNKRDVVIVGKTGMQMKQMHRVKVVALTNFMEVFFPMALENSK